MSFDKVQNYHDIDAPQLDNYKSTRTIELRGPYSPLEMKLYGLVQSAGDKAVEIEGNSVNTVLLDSEPQDYHTR